MRPEDIAEVLRIEREVYPFPWSKGIFLDCLQAGYSCWLLEDQGIIDGYGIMLVAVGEAQIMNVCVRPSARRQGKGRQIMQWLLHLAKRHHADTALLEVRPSNVSALALYDALGFNEVGRRPAYYPTSNGREDALILACHLAEDAPLE